MEKLGAGNFRLASCQATLFTPDEEVSATKLLKALIPKWIEHFDAEPCVVPLQEVVPRELPRLILESKTQAWKCEIASERINLFWRRLKNADPEPSLQDFFSTAMKFLAEYVELQGARVGRVAAVLKRYADCPEPGSYLVTHFCQEQWLTGPMKAAGSFELHVRANYNLADKFPVNSWIRNKTGITAPPDDQCHIVLVEQDLNTLAENAAAASFDVSEITSFFTAASIDFDKTLKTYYPG